MSLAERKPIDLRVSSYFRTPPESMSGNLQLWKAGTRNEGTNPHIALAITLGQRGMPVYVGPHILPDGSTQVWSLDIDGKIIQMHTLADIRCLQEALGVIDRVSATDPYRLLVMAHEGDPDSSEEVQSLLHGLEERHVSWTAAIAKLYLNSVTQARQREAIRRTHEEKRIIFPVDVKDGKWQKADVLYKEWSQMVSLENVLNFPQAVSKMVETLVDESNLPSSLPAQELESNSPIFQQDLL